MQYFFILGRNPELSLAELHAVLPIGYKALACSCEVLVVECPELVVEKLMKRLGGTVKMGQIVAHNPLQLPLISDALRGRSPTEASDLGGREQSKKLFLGLSAYALDDKVQLPSVRELREMGIGLKRELQAQGYRVRLVTSKERDLSSVIVKKEKLLSQGAEIVLLYAASSGNTTTLRTTSYPLRPQSIGRTLAVQEFEEASIRDFGRPVREMKVGLLPIQLAKIMINLARAPLDATLLDPFCGFGTILAEARLMGYTNLIGSDLEQKMVDATRKNLEWLQTKFTVDSSQFTVTLTASPVEQLSQHLPPHSVDAIVTEPYLGPTRGMKNYELRIMNELVKLYTNSFHAFSKILKPDSRVVFIFPAFKSGTQLIKTSTPVLPKIKNLGFSPIQLLPTSYSLRPTYSITYSRPDQRVRREIMVLEFRPQL